jgi:RNA polymerase subunit RPABC4/transcription elongation factor Spt4
VENEMIYQAQLTCKQKKCGTALTIPLKLVVKDDKLIDVARCSKCHDSYKFILPMNEKDQWLPLVGKAYFQCDECGTANEDNWKFAKDIMLVNTPLVKTITKCKRCGKERAKIISRSLWEGVAAQIKTPTTPAPAAAPAPAPAAAPPRTAAPSRPITPPPTALPPTTRLKCPSCGTAVGVDAKICPKCRIELMCDKCGARILPGAKFCGACGDPVERMAAPLPPSPTKVKTITCPACQEENSLDSSFCAVCGQELICDKCHRLIREGASFCSYCGDPVSKGKLSI